MYFHLFGTEYCNPLLLVGFPGRSGRFIKPFYFTVLFVTKSADCCMCIVSLPMDQLSWTWKFLIMVAFVDELHHRFLCVCGVGFSIHDMPLRWRIHPLPLLSCKSIYTPLFAGLTCHRVETEIGALQENCPLENGKTLEARSQANKSNSIEICNRFPRDSWVQGSWRHLSGSVIKKQWGFENILLLVRFILQCHSRHYVKRTSETQRNVWTCIVSLWDKLSERGD